LEKSGTEFIWYHLFHRKTANSERNYLHQTTPLCSLGLESSPRLPHHPVPISRHRSRPMPTTPPLHHFPLLPSQERPLLPLSSQSPTTFRTKSRSPPLLSSSLLPGLVAHYHPDSRDEARSAVLWQGSVGVVSHRCLTALLGWTGWASVVASAGWWWGVGVGEELVLVQLVFDPRVGEGFDDGTSEGAESWYHGDGRMDEVVR